MNPGDTDDLEIADELDSIPTIIMGSPKTLATGTNPALEAGDANVAATSSTGVNIGEGDGGMVYTLAVQNTTDISERLRIIHSAGDMQTGTATWINVTTGHTRADLVNLPGTVVLSYNIEGPAGLMSSTDVNVYVTDDGCLLYTSPSPRD